MKTIYHKFHSYEIYVPCGYRFHILITFSADRNDFSKVSHLKKVCTQGRDNDFSFHLRSLHQPRYMYCLRSTSVIFISYLRLASNHKNILLIHRLSLRSMVSSLPTCTFFLKENKNVSHQENMSVKCIPPQTPLLYRKTGVYVGITKFLIFAPKHRLWVLIRTTSARLFLRIPTILD